MSLSFKTCFNPTFWPRNLLEGPETLAYFTFFENPWRIFSATSDRVELGLSITGMFSFFFPWCFV